MKEVEGKKEDSAERLNVGRIDHIVLAYQNRENLDRAREEFSALLGVDDWEDLGEIEEVRLQIWISWQAGLELICPTGAGSFPNKGRFLPGGTLVVRNALSGGAENAALNSHS